MAPASQDLSLSCPSRASRAHQEVSPTSHPAPAQVSQEGEASYPKAGTGTTTPPPQGLGWVLSAASQPASLPPPPPDLQLSPDFPGRKPSPAPERTSLRDARRIPRRCRSVRLSKNAPHTLRFRLEKKRLGMREHHHPLLRLLTRVSLLRPSAVILIMMYLM